MQMKGPGLLVVFYKGQTWSKSQYEFGQPFWSILKLERLYLTKTLDGYHNPGTYKKFAMLVPVLFFGESTENAIVFNKKYFVWRRNTV